MPYLAYGEVAQVDLAELSDYVQKLTASGALTPDEKLEEYLREVSGLPPMSADGGIPMYAPMQAPKPQEVPEVIAPTDLPDVKAPTPSPTPQGNNQPLPPRG
jgi:hypothetical protein